MLRYLPRILVFLICVFGAWYFFSEFSKIEHTREEIVVDENVEVAGAGVSDMGGKAMVNLGGFIVMALVAAILFGLTILPVVGEIIGGAFFNPGGEIEKDPHHDAMAFMAQGDYDGAIAAYRKVVADNPHDTHAISEIARINIDKLHNPAGAAEAFENALQTEWPPDEGGFLAMRLAEVYWTHFGDAERAKAVLEQIKETMPGTRHAANANHKIIEIDRVMAEQDGTTQDQET